MDKKRGEKVGDRGSIKRWRERGKMEKGEDKWIIKQGDERGG